MPTTLNVSSLDLLHPELVRRRRDDRRPARALMDAYVALGCRPTWTCAPYQLPDRPASASTSPGPSRTRSCSPTRSSARGPTATATSSTSAPPSPGARRRRACTGTRSALRASWSSGRGVPDRLLVRGLRARRPSATSSARWRARRCPRSSACLRATARGPLKAFGAAAASSGAVGMFHAVGVTPEAPTLEAALGGPRARERGDVTVEDLRMARDRAERRRRGQLGAVSVGTPHFSLAEFDQLVRARRRARSPPASMFVTGPRLLAATGASAGRLPERGVTVVTDTCTYITPILAQRARGR